MHRSLESVFPEAQMTIGGRSGDARDNTRRGGGENSRFGFLGLFWSPPDAIINYQGGASCTLAVNTVSQGIFNREP
jgi:hypothetical protein